MVTATAVIALGLASPVFAQEQAAPAAEMTDSEWQLLEERIDARANEIANSRQFFEDDRRPITVKAKLDRASNILFLHLDVSFGNDVGDLPLEDFMSGIRYGMEDLTATIPGFNRVEWVIGGHDMDYWFQR